MGVNITITCLRLVGEHLSRGGFDEVVSVLPPSECAAPGSGSPFAWPETDVPRTVVAFSDLGTDWDSTEAEVRAVLASHRSLVPCTDDEVIKLLVSCAEMMERGRSRPWHVLFHCNAGTSRSVAAAYVLLAMRLGPGREAEAMEELAGLTQDGRPTPNHLLVERADRLLGRGGAMVAAARSRMEADEEKWLDETGVAGDDDAPGPRPDAMEGRPDPREASARLQRLLSREGEAGCDVMWWDMATRRGAALRRRAEADLADQARAVPAAVAVARRAHGLALLRVSRVEAAEARRRLADAATDTTAFRALMGWDPRR